MFTADLSWTDTGTEKVGERKERIAKEEKARSISSASIHSHKCSQNSGSTDREASWWHSSLKKASGVKPTKISLPKGGRDKVGARCPLPLGREMSKPDMVRDPTTQPAWTYSASLSPKLPSGASLDPTEYEVPELEGDTSSGRTISSGSRSSHDRRWGLKSPSKMRVMGDLREIRQSSPQSYFANTTEIGSEKKVLEGRRAISTHENQIQMKKKKLSSVRVERCLDVDELKFHDDMLRQQHPEEFGTPTSDSGPSCLSDLLDASFVIRSPSSDPSIVLPKSHQIDTDDTVLPRSAQDAGVNPNFGITSFQRFIRRMESAGPRIILDRLKEEWPNPGDAETYAEMMLEKQLWVLTAFQLENLARYSRFPKSNVGRSLELYGNVSEVYQLSAMYPRQRIHYLTTSHPLQAIPLPENVTCALASQTGIIPLPYYDSSFSHIRASSLPSQVPSSRLPEIFRDCYRLLAPGGMLELRIMDAAPMRGTAGPKTKAWMEYRVSDNLERHFRCSRPCTLVADWVAKAGFDLPATLPGDQENVRLRCAHDKSSSEVNGELSAIVCRSLWKDIWGEFVDDIQDKPRWWWEDEEVMNECLERETVFECGSIFAFKPKSYGIDGVHAYRSG